MLTTNKSRNALETVEWIGIGAVVVIVAIAAYRILGTQIVGWINNVAASIGG